ncbi:MAG: amino acid-binding protein [Candidatus Odinarchaeia archaeon]
MYIEVIKIWNKIKEKHLKRYPTRLKVAKLLIELGCHIKEDGKIYCGSVELSPVKIARALEVDRRVVSKTIEMILNDPELKTFFGNISGAGPSFKNVAKQFGFSVIEIYADPKAVGIIAEVTRLLAERNINIRQIFAEDPELQPNPKLIVIAEGELPGDIIPQILKVKTVKKVTTY